MGRCESAGAAGRADVIGKTLSGGDLVSKVPKTHSCFLPVLFSLHDKHFLLSWFPSTSSQTFSQTCSSPALFFLLFLYYLGDMSGSMRAMILPAFLQRGHGPTPSFLRASLLSNQPGPRTPHLHQPGCPFCPLCLPGDLALGCQLQSQNCEKTS